MTFVMTSTLMVVFPTDLQPYHTLVRLPLRQGFLSASAANLAKI